MPYYTLTQIAERVGVDKSNVLRMLKRHKFDLPFARVQDKRGFFQKQRVLAAEDLEAALNLWRDVLLDT